MVTKELQGFENMKSFKAGTSMTGFDTLRNGFAT